jgi:hypothetical protein
MYAFQVDADGRKRHEVAASAETFPENVDRSTAGRVWHPDYLVELRERTDSKAARFMVALCCSEVAS